MPRLAVAGCISHSNTVAARSRQFPPIAISFLVFESDGRDVPRPCARGQAVPIFLTAAFRLRRGHDEAGGLRPSQLPRVIFHCSALDSPLWCGSSIWPTNSAPVFCLTRREATLDAALQTKKLSRPSVKKAKSFTAAVASV